MGPHQRLAMMKEEEKRDQSRGRSPSKGSSGDPITAKFKARSVSLTRNDGKKKTSPRKIAFPSKKIASPSKRKRKSPPETSPNLTVKERKSHFEAVQEKYRNQRCQKQSREKFKTKRDQKPKASQEEDDDSIASLLKRISADIGTMKVDLKESNQKIDSVNDKISEIESNAEKTAKANKLQFEMINGKVAHLETNITDKVIEKIDPQIKSLKSDLRNEFKNDLENLVTNEIAKRFPEKDGGVNKGDKVSDTLTSNPVDPKEVERMIEEAVAKRWPPVKNSEDAHSEDSEVGKGEPTKKKNKKPKKKIKNKKPKKNEDKEVQPEEDTTA